MGERLSVSQNARSSAEVCHPMHTCMSYNIIFVVHIITRPIHLSLRHCMVYHIPTMFKKYDNLKQFPDKVYMYISTMHLEKSSEVSVDRRY